jgi:hypothetical protein
MITCQVRTASALSAIHFWSDPIHFFPFYLAWSKVVAEIGDVSELEW